MTDEEIQQAVEKQIQEADDIRNLGLIRELAEQLVKKAELFNIVLTISQRPLQPLAMRNYETVVDVRKFNGEKPNAG